MSIPVRLSGGVIRKYTIDEILGSDFEDSGDDDSESDDHQNSANIDGNEPSKEIPDPDQELGNLMYILNQEMNGPYSCTPGLSSSAPSAYTPSAKESVEVSTSVDDQPQNINIFELPLRIRSLPYRLVPRIRNLPHRPVMNVLHNPMFDYNTALSQFLEARRQQSHSIGLGFLPALRSASGSDTTDSLSPSPPAINNSGKSFTIDAILGLRCTTTSSNAGVLDYSHTSNKRSNAGEKQEESNKHGSKSKRVRTIFTPEQLERLEAEFERQQYMVGPERLYLAHTLQLTEAQVKVWFQNRRIKWRKQHLEMTQQRLALLKQHRQQRLLQQQVQQQISDSPNNLEDSQNSEHYVHNLLS